MDKILIIKNIFKYFEVNIFVYFFAIVAILSASFVPFFIISFLIIIHELGHFLIAKFLKIDVVKIYLYPLGGIAKFNMKQNVSLVKELLILIMGPLFQIMAYLFLRTFLSHYQEMITIYHYGILLFNLLPIFPLDGGKLVNIFLTSLFSFKISYYLSIIISYLLVVVIFFLNINNLNLNFLLVVCFLLFKITSEYKKINYYYQKFLLERYLNDYNFKKTKLINNGLNFYRNKKHLLKIEDKYMWEDDFLQKLFKNS